MLTKQQFSVLFSAWKNREEKLTQRELCRLTGLSLGKINEVTGELREAELLTPELALTRNGMEALEPYRVRNAVIMAAGMSTRFAPLSYEKPKALLRVRGEILIEREIRQLQEAGIRNITLVVGYMKEKLFYLEDKFGVKIVVNGDYSRYNNPSSLMLVTELLDNTYVCSSDNYFTENVFEPYVYRAYYAAVYAPGKTDEYCMTVNRKDRITAVSVGGEAAWFMIGHVYFSREFSRAFVRILKDEYDRPPTKTQLWEDLLIRHLGELEMYIRRYDASAVKEFDSLDELRDFDPNYIANADSKVFRNIEKVLRCRDEDITDIHPIKTGLTNTSFEFSCGGGKYVYRHPGVGTEAYINRKSEACSMQAAKELGLDDTFLYIDPAEGWKVSRFIENAKTLDYHRKDEVDTALKMIRTLHRSGRRTPYRFDIWAEIARFERRLKKCGRNDFEDMEAMGRDIAELHCDTDADGVAPCLCHCDCYDPNFLIDGNGKMYLIDWEYSGMADPACDLGTFLACSDYDMAQADDVIARYLEHEPSPEELRHFLAYAAALSFYWFVWAIYQDSVGKSVGEYLYVWYRYTKSYSRRALAMYRESAAEEGRESK